MKEGAAEVIIASVSLQDGEDLMGRPAPPPASLSPVRSCKSRED